MEWRITLLVDQPEQLLLRPDGRQWEILVGRPFYMRIASAPFSVIRMENIDVVRAFASAVEKHLAELKSIVTTKRRHKGLSDFVSRTPRRTILDRLFDSLGGRKRDAVAVELRLRDASQVEANVEGLTLSLGRTDDGSVVLRLDNIPSAEKLLSLLTEMIRKYDKSPFGPDTEYGKLLAEKRDQAALFVREMRVSLEEHADDLRLDVNDDRVDVNDDRAFVSTIVSIVDGDRCELRDAILDSLQVRLATYRYPPRWASEIADRYLRRDARD